VEAVRRMEKVREETKLPYRDLCRLTTLPYSTFMRWKGRLQRGEGLIKTPGPKKLPGLLRETIREEIARLRHGRVRTAGTGALYRRYRLHISRRALQREAKAYRRELHRREKEEMERIRWLVPGAVWAMDDTEEPLMGKIHLVQDAASRYKLSVLPETALIEGKEVAENLQTLFERHGAPLAFKRDNGSNVNHSAVDQVLWQHLVIPLNSPPHYPRYNGQVERGQREVSEAVNELPAEALPVALRRKLWARLIAAELNHRRRPCLNGQTACAVFNGGRKSMKRYNRVRRKQAYAHVVRMFTAHLNGLSRWTKRSVDAAWRRAVETWLLQEGIIAITKGKSVTPFSLNLVS